MTFIGENSSMKKSSLHVTVAVILCLAVSLLVSVSPALAHDRVEVGPYVIVIGWEKEPVIVGERNAIVFEISEDEAPVEGLELEAQVNYAGETFSGNLSPTGAPGAYSLEILPTVRGQYQVLLSGAIGDTQVNESLEPEEVLPARTLQFPQFAPDALELQATIDDLAGQLQTARLLTIAALLITLVAIVIAVIGLLRSRK